MIGYRRDKYIDCYHDSVLLPIQLLWMVEYFMYETLYDPRIDRAF